MPLPILYSYRRCPYAMRARLALWQADQAVELREIELRNKPRAMLEASPKGTVPVLVLPDGSVLEQSMDIMLWALRRHDPDGWLQAAPWAEQVIWIELNDGAFKQTLDRYKYPERQTPAVAQSQSFAEALDLMLLPLEKQLQKSGSSKAVSHLFGPQCSVADMALMPFIRQFAAVNPSRFQAAALPHVQQWLQRLTQLPLFDRVMQKQPTWGEPIITDHADLTSH